MSPPDPGSGPGIVIRDAVDTDAAACAAVYAPYVVGTTVSFEEQPPDAEEMTRRIVAAQDRHAWLVAERDGRVVGYAYGGPWRSRAAYQHTCEVSVYVGADAQGGGVGRALYTALLDRMRELGMHTALGGTAMPNDASERLHDALGFEVIGTFREVGRKRGRWCDVRWFQKLL